MTAPDVPSASLWDEHGPKISGLIIFALVLAGQPDDVVPGALLRDGVFLSLGMGIAQGIGAAYAHLPGPESVGWVGLGFPVVLSVLTRMWPLPDGVALIQLFNALCVGGAAWGLCALGRRLVFPSAWWDLAVVLGFALPAVTGLTHAAVPEPMFAVLAVAALVIGSGRAEHRWNALLLGGCVGAAVVTSGLGLPVAAAVGFSTFGKRRLAPFVVGGIAVLVVPWLWWCLSTTTGPTALASLELATAGREGAGLEWVVRALWSPHPVVFWVGAVVTAVWATVGLVAVWRMDRPTAVGLGGIVVVALAWPTAPREWAAIGVPFLLALSAVGARRTWGADRRARIPVAAVAVGWVAWAGWSTIGSLRPDAGERVAGYRSATHLALTSIRNEVSADAVIATDADAMVYVYTNRRTLPLTVIPPDADARALCDRDVTHLALFQSGELPERFADAPAAAVLRRAFDLTDGPALYELACS